MHPTYSGAMSNDAPLSQRQIDARRRIELAEQGVRAEAVAAQKLINEFIDEANRQGITPEPLRATLMNGTPVKTDKQGWYLRRNPGGAMARFTGVKLKPTPPPMVIGRGGRDGETGDLQEFLDWRLADGNGPA